MQFIEMMQNLHNLNFLDMVELDHAMFNECTYADLNDNFMQSELSETLKVGHINIHSIPNKYEDLIDILDTMQEKHILPDVLLLCETFLNERNYDKYPFQNYDIVSEYRKQRSRGGVSIMIKTQIRYIVRTDLRVFEEGKFESVFVEIPRKHRSNIIIGEIYRVPGTNERDFINYYDSIISKIRDEAKKIIIGTDQNMDYLKINTHRNTQKLFELNLTNNVLPTIFKPTRVTNSSATLIDNIYVDTEIGCNISSHIITTDISDHFLCLTIIHNIKINNNMTQSSKRKINDSVLRNIKGALSNKDWNYLNEMDINDACSALNTEINKAIDFYAPLKKIINNRKYKKRDPWFTIGLKTSSVKCWKMYKQVMHKPHDSIEYIAYKKYRNLYSQLRRKAKYQYTHDLISACRNDCKRMWGILNRMSGKVRKADNVSDEINVDGIKVSDPKKISNAFAKYYSEIGKCMSENIEKQGPTFDATANITNMVNESCFFFPTTHNEIECLIRGLKLKNSTGHDGLSNTILRSVYPSILHALFIIFNKSLSSGIVPDFMKIAIVKPLYKAKSVFEINNYRPISLLPVVSKILEKIVHIRLANFLKNHNVLFEGQYGFRKCRNTTDAILDLTGNIIDGLNKKMYTIGLFLDMSKAFDSIKHETLLKKLELYGIRGLALDWLKSYLTNRSIKVMFKEVLSDKYKVNFGTPQGSVLGPLLYIILSNDMPKCLKFSRAVMFADDTTIYATGNNVRFLYTKINEDLKKVTQWFKNNSLSLNIEKTCYILFKNANSRPNFNGKIYIDNKEIEQVTETKFLGVCIDDHLTWNNHVQNLLLKLASGIYSLNMVRNMLSPNTKRLIYFSHVFSHLTYAMSVWGPMITSSNMNKLQVSQNKAVRSIFNLKRRTRLAPYYKKGQLLDIKNLIELSLVKISHRYTEDILPQRIVNLFENINHNHETRNRNLLQAAPHTSQIYSKSFLGRAPHVWLHLPRDLKTISNIKRFNKCFVEYKINQILN